MAKIYVMIRIEVGDDADQGWVVQEMDYTLRHRDIVSYEIVDTDAEPGESQ